MFVSLKKYETAVAGAARAAELATQLARSQAETQNARREIQRLTNIIVAMKKDDKSPSPQATDEHWGKYSQQDYEAGESEGAPTTPDPEIPDDVALRAERELAAELERVLDEE